MFFLSILIYILTGLLVLIGLILVVPFGYRFYAQRYEETFLKAQGSWLFGAICFNFYWEWDKDKIMYLNLFGLRFRIGKAIDKKDNREKIKDKKSKDKKEKKGSPMEIDYLIEIVKTAIKAIIHIKPKEFNLDARVGFEDPYYTGTLCGILNTLQNHIKAPGLKVVCDFEDEVIEGKCLILGRLVLGVLALMALKLYLPRLFKINKFKKAKFKEVNDYGS